MSEVCVKGYHRVDHKGNTRGWDKKPCDCLAQLEKENKRLLGQINKLGDFILSEVEGEPSQSEGAVDVAIRLLKENKELKEDNDVLRTDNFLLQEKRALQETMTHSQRKENKRYREVLESILYSEYQTDPSWNQMLPTQLIYKTAREALGLESTENVQQEWNTRT